MATKIIEQQHESVRTTRSFGFDLGAMTRMHWIAANLAAIAGAIHLYLYKRCTQSTSGLGSEGEGRTHR